MSQDIPRSAIAKSHKEDAQLDFEIVSLITTKNESKNIEAALSSIAPLSKRVLIVDSFSTDQTQEVALRVGQSLQLDLEFLCREYVSPSDQKNWGIRHIMSRQSDNSRPRYVLILDADELLTSELVTEIQSQLSRHPVDCYYIPRANYFMGQMIRHSNWYPDYCLRLFRPGSAWYEDVKVHEHMVPSGTVAYLTSPLTHYSYTSITQYLEKLNRYTDWEIESAQLYTTRLSRFGRLRRVFSLVPMRPLARMFYMYVLRLGFLDGKRGFQIAVLSGFYEWVVDLKREYRSVPPQAPED